MAGYVQNPNEEDEQECAVEEDEQARNTAITQIRLSHKRQQQTVLTRSCAEPEPVLFIPRATAASYSMPALDAQELQINYINLEKLD